MNRKIEGIVVSEVSYGDTSKIINVLTKNDGRIGLMARGCKNIKSSLRTTTTKLSYGIFTMIYKPDKLSILTDVEILNSYSKIKKDITKVSYSSFLLELSDQVSRQTDDNIFNILVSALNKINEGFDPVVISNIVELKYLDYLGVAPTFDCCSACGTKANIKTISSSLGGYVCGSCFTNDYIVSEKTIKMIRMLSLVDIEKISKTNISDQIKIEISVFLDEYYERYTGLYLNSKAFLKNLTALDKE